ASIPAAVALALKVTVSVLPAPPAKLPMTVPPKLTLLPATPISPAPPPWLRIATVSSVARPETVSVPPLKLLSASLKVTLASRSCGVALTVFSRKVTGVVRPVRVGTELAIQLLPSPFASFRRDGRKNQKSSRGLRARPARGTNQFDRHGELMLT